jgi:hypothetical protein
LIVQGEISEARYQERLNKLLSHHAGADGSLPDLKGYVYVKNGAPKIDGDSFALLKSWVEKIKPDIIVLDPIYKFLRYSDENSHSSMRLIFDRLDELKSLGVGLVIVHHNRKAYSGESDASMGSARGAGWEEWADSIMALRRNTADKFRVKVSFELRNAEEPSDLIVSRDPETLWGTISGYATDNRRKATAIDARDALIEMGGHAASKADLTRKIMEKYQVSDKTAETRIDDALKDDLIRTVPGQGKHPGYRVSIPKFTESLPYADD